MKEKYLIVLSGCDDETEFEVRLTKDEHILMRKIAKKSINTSIYGCMPTLGIEKVK